MEIHQQLCKQETAAGTQKGQQHQHVFSPGRRSMLANVMSDT
jgi:hypothetical protein